MAFVIGVLTAIMVLDCLLLVLLVLMQLPKKDAGAGLAFGGAATDALFGAGSGNFLTKATKYAAVLFFVLAIILPVMHNHFARRPGSQFLRDLERESQAAPAAAQTPAPTTTLPAQPPGGALIPLNQSATNAIVEPPTGTNSTAPETESGQ